MPQNPLLQLREYGQSAWLDNIDRTILRSGELQRLVSSGEVQGVTSNPTIFQKAIASCADYDLAIETLGRAGKDTLAIWEGLSTEDIRAAADVLLPVFERTQGGDGYVSIEVEPSLAHDLQGTVVEARRLFDTIARPNVMIKVPATQEGVTAVTELVSAGVNVNATLIFSPDNYGQIAQAYIEGLERLAARGQPGAGPASVASFFVSRLDTAVDGLLEARLKETSDPGEQGRIGRLLGQAAIANAKVAYQRFKRIFGQERFRSLEQQGARFQRPLWASTSTKNPAYSDVLYVEELIGPNTVNTMPPATLEAFRDHGKARLSLEENVGHAYWVFERLAQLDIDIERVYEDLQTAGIQAFAESFEGVLSCIRERQIALKRA